MLNMWPHKLMLDDEKLGHVGLAHKSVLAIVFA
jgi:hypothetical protein